MYALFSEKILKVTQILQLCKFIDKYMVIFSTGPPPKMHRLNHDNQHVPDDYHNYDDLGDHGNHYDHDNHDDHDNHPVQADRPIS